MSRRGWGLAVALLAVLCGAAWVGVSALQHSARALAAERNAQAADLLAWALSAHAGDVQAVRRLLDEQFDRGQLLHLRLLGPQGEVLHERRADGEGNAAPQESAGMAPVVEGQRIVARLQVRARPGADGNALADARAVWMAALLGVGLAFVVAMTWSAQRSRLDVRRLTARAAALGRGAVDSAPTGVVSPQMRGLAVELEGAEQRLQKLQRAREESQAELSRLRDVDGLTGLFHRSAFLLRLQEVLETREGASGLIILRLRHLEAMNLRVGHGAVDGLLAAVGGMVASYPARVPGAFAGRLNGGDFGLYLPAQGVALETAQALWAALRAALFRVDPAGDLAIGGVDGLPPGSASSALSAADAALAQAEAQGALSIVVTSASPEAPAQDLPDPQWREHVGVAMNRGQVRMMEEEQGGWMACRLQVPALDGEGWVDAAPRLAQGARSRLTQRADLLLVGLALSAIAADGRPRAVELALPSLAEAGFVNEVLRLLQAQHQAAPGLCVRVRAQAAAAHPGWEQAAAPWQALGVKLAVEGRLS